MTTASRTVQRAQALLQQREEAGRAKYGTDVDRTDLLASDWLQHAIEEAADKLLYLLRARDQVRALEAQLGPTTGDLSPVETACLHSLKTLGPMSTEAAAILARSTEARTSHALNKLCRRGLARLQPTTRPAKGRPIKVFEARHD